MAGQRAAGRALFAPKSRTHDSRKSGTRLGRRPSAAQEELFRYFTLSPADSAFVAPQGRGVSVRLGLAAILCSLPWLGSRGRHRRRARPARPHRLPAAARARHPLLSSTQLLQDGGPEIRFDLPVGGRCRLVVWTKRRTATRSESLLAAPGCPHARSGSGPTTE
nr:DUF4158 domain-containing protein [Nocardia abscessus]